MDSRQTLDTAAGNTRPDPIRNPRSAAFGAARALFLAAALLSFGLSVGLFFSGEENEGIFVGLWVPSILALGAFVAPRRDRDRATDVGGGSR